MYKQLLESTNGLDGLKRAIDKINEIESYEKMV